ncbi:MAG: nickel pincer cofactor biosynthesis protein LarC [Nitrospinae bacterium]|nr:nickel pincer cofactor biosynthesis protein LarC [Nitrospinota bacterium]
MKIAYFDCFSGISGDMTLGAFVDAGLSFDLLKSEIAKTGLQGYGITAGKVKKNGFIATKIDVAVDVSAVKGHRHYPDIVKIIEKSGLKPEVKEIALNVFRVIADAEAEAHGVPVEKVHFHEVGAVDSIVDVVGAAVGFVELGIREVYSSPVNVGSGTVKTDHGVLPVPAPATAHILRGIPTYADGPQMELATPTGAAILKAMAKSFGGQPAMNVTSIGMGAGSHDFPNRPNVLRLFLGETASSMLLDERLVELSTNIDDMNPQIYPLVAEKLFTAGALDVTFIPVVMKKGRPATLIEVLCAPDKSEEAQGILFTETTTLGIRIREVTRVSLLRHIKKVATEYGEIEVKVAELPNGGVKVAPEYESVKKAAEKNGVTFEMVYRATLRSVG